MVYARLWLFDFNKNNFGDVSAFFLQDEVREVYFQRQGIFTIRCSRSALG